MRYLPFILIAIVLIALDWAALHDIMKGEADLTGEWIIVAASGLIFGLMVGILFRPKQKRER